MKDPKTNQCNACEAKMIQGVYCHELGCPEAFRDHGRECKWCGAMFKPDESRPVCCSEDCYESYCG